MNKIELLKELIEIFKKTLSSSKFNFLHNVYEYNKKKKYGNYSWMVKELSNWGMNIPQKTYKTWDDVILEIEILDPINPAYIEYLLLRHKKNVNNNALFNSSKYKQVRFLYIKYEKYVKSQIKNGPLELIKWIEPVFPEAYEAISKSSNWNTKIHLHIDRIHTAIHKLLKDILRSKNIIFDRKKNINILYQNLISKANENKQETNLIACDANILAMLNRIRNNGSLAHPNKLDKISKDIGILFLSNIKNVVDRINNLAKYVNIEKLNDLEQRTAKKFIN